MQNAHYQTPPYGQTTQTVQFISAPAIGDGPQIMQCPACHATITTKVTHEASSKTHLVALGLCLFVGTCCLCLLPYCKFQLKLNSNLHNFFLLLRHQLMQDCQPYLSTVRQLHRISRRSKVLVSMRTSGNHFLKSNFLMFYTQISKSFVFWL